MDRVKSLANKYPLIFGITITFIFLLMLVVSAVLGNLWPGEATYGQPGGIVGRLISITILIMLLSSLGWLRVAGFTSLSRWRTWLMVLLPMVYSIAVLAFAMTGKVDIGNFDLAMPGLVALFILTAAFLEEADFRGVILHGFVRVWGKTNRGIIKSVLVSSLLFSSIHLLDFLSERPFPGVLLQAMEAFFLGVFLAALVLISKSIYPAAFFHAVLNLAAYQIFAGNSLEPAASSWLLLSLLMLPIAILGICSLRILPQRSRDSISPPNWRATGVDS